VALRAYVTEGFPSFVRGEGFAAAEHPDAALFLQGRGAAPGPQGDLIALDGKVKSVPGREAQLVTECLGKDNAARSIEGDFTAHYPIVRWSYPFGRWYLQDPIASKAMYIGGCPLPGRASVCGPRGISEALFRHPLLGLTIEFGQFPGQTSTLITLGEHVHGALHRAAAVREYTFLNPAIEFRDSLLV